MISAITGLLFTYMPDGWLEVSNRKVMTGHLDTGFFSWFSWVLEQMLGWFPFYLSKLPLHASHVALPN
jgi:hypothetical protein